MMPSRSTPNLRDVHQQQQQQQQHSHAPVSHRNHHHQRDHAYYRPPAPPTAASSRDEDCSPPPAPPVRDSSSLRAVKYGPGHEKFPSWPVPAAADTPQALRNQNNGGSHRSKSWTDHTNYPKEKVVTYTRPYMKRQHSVYTQQKLKTVMERCEKIPPEAFESRSVPSPSPPHHHYLPTMDPDGKQLGDAEYSVPSPPERDLSTKPRLTRADLEEYARTYCQEEEEETRARLTESGLEEFMQYTHSYEESIFSSISSKHDSSILNHMHQKQTSYAQSEGYHSYVSSTDSTSTPFLDRLRRDSEAVPRTPSSWDDLEQMSSTAELEPTSRCGVAGSSVSGEGGRDSVVTTSSGSASSSETLKWHGSMSDVSCGGGGGGSSSLSGATRQLIAHSARVQTPQRHHSESVLYMTGSEKEANWKERESRINRENAKLKLFAVNTYTVQQQQQQQQKEQQQHTSAREGNGSNTNNRLSLSLQSALSVADRISELEKQQKYSYLDPEKKHKIPDPTLKAIQKKALLSFYERHNNPNNKNTWRSEPQLSPQQQHQQRQQQQQMNGPQPPPKVKIQLPSRRASSASDYASGCNSKRSSLASSLESSQSRTLPRHQHSNSCSSLSADLLGPVIVGASISVDDYVPEKPPERPPKNPKLRSAFPDLFQEPRVPSPDLPPPSPPPMVEDEVFNNDEPLPPPPPECETDWTDLKDRFKDGATSNQTPGPQIQKGNSSNSKKEAAPLQQTVGIPEKSPRHSTMRASIRSKFGEHIFQQAYASSVHTEKPAKTEVLGFPNQRGYQERSSTRYPNTSKYAFNGAVAVSQKANGISEQFRPEPLRSLTRESKLLHQPSTLPAQRASIAESPVKEVPPPLQPRQMRINQSMRARGPHDHRAALAATAGKEQRSSSMSQSKSSYLAPRRDRDRIIPDSETGSYKRTMSPNGHALTPEESLRINSRETVWPSAGKETIIRKASSVAEKKLTDDKRNSEEDLKKPIVLPDVLPVNVKLLGPRSQQYTRPTHLSLSPLDPGETKRSPKSPPSSPPKSPSRNSPFAPLRTISMSPLDPHGESKTRSGSVQSNHCETSSPTSPPKSPSRNSPFAPLRTISLSTATTITTSSSPKFSISAANKRTPPPLPNSSPPGSPKGQSSPKNRTPPSPRKSSPPLIKPSLSPNASVKLSSVRQASSTTNTPLHASPLASPESPKCGMLTKKLEDYPKVEEGLQMIQRTEVVLRVNTTTTDAASQTEAEELSPPEPMPLPIRKKFQEEIECEKLAEDFIDHLPHSDRLKEILVPAPEYKKPTDYVQGLFRVDITTKPRPNNSPFRSRNNTPSSSPPPTISSVSLCTTTSTSTTTRLSISPPILSTSIPSVVPMVEPTSPLSGSSSYFTTSEPKAKFLTRYSQDMNKCYVVKNTKDLSQKKEELVNRLDKKLEVLRGEQVVVTDECKINDELGENVESHINRLARPHEVAKFRLHVEEVGKITSLLLGLSGRLARAENALIDMAEEHPERRILEAKRDKLLEQLEEAKKLKESIDRRSVSVSNILNKYLNSDEYADYDHFINMKAKLIMDSKEISDKIKLGEEQLVALKETLIVTD